MRIVELIDGAFEIRWTWLPLWLATNPLLKTTLETELKTIIALNGVTDTEADLDTLHSHVVRRLAEMFPGVKGLDLYLNGMSSLELA
jgi:hypothetical protein